jgi:hypothetical protein
MRLVELLTWALFSTGRHVGWGIWPYIVGLRDDPTYLRQMTQTWFFHDKSRYILPLSAFRGDSSVTVHTIAITMPEVTHWKCATFFTLSWTWMHVTYLVLIQEKGQQLCAWSEVILKMMNPRNPELWIPRPNAHPRQCHLQIGASIMLECFHKEDGTNLLK